VLLAALAALAADDDASASAACAILHALMARDLHDATLDDEHLIALLPLLDDRLALCPDALLEPIAIATGAATAEAATEASEGLDEATRLWFAVHNVELIEELLPLRLRQGGEEWQVLQEGGDVVLLKGLRERRGERAIAHETLNVRHRQPDRAQLADGDHGLVALRRVAAEAHGLVSREGLLPEEVTAPKLLTQRAVLGRLGLALEHDEEGVRRVALGEDGLSWLEGFRLRDGGERLALRRAKCAQALNRSHEVRQARSDVPGLLDGCTRE